MTQAQWLDLEYHKQWELYNEHRRQLGEAQEALQYSRGQHNVTRRSLSRWQDEAVRLEREANTAREAQRQAEARIRSLTDSCNWYYRELEKQKARADKAESALAQERKHVAAEHRGKVAAEAERDVLKQRVEELEGTDG